MEKLDESSVELTEKNAQIETLKKFVAKVQRERDQSMKYNKELRNQIELLNAKLHVHQRLNKATFSDAQTQTDFDEMNFRFSNSTQSNSNSKDESWKSKSERSNTRIADLVKEAAENVLVLSDYIYDENSKTYYSRSSGWYFYPDCSLFYDPHSKNYYKYDYETKSYSFYSSLEETNSKRNAIGKQRNSKKKKSKRETNQNDGVINITSSEEEQEEEEEEGEIDSCSSENEDNDVEFIEEDKIDHGPPCVRMIVLESATLEEGSLLLINCMGGRIGNDSRADVWITDDSVSKNHAQVVYEEDLKNYMIKDLDSINGTFKNGIKLNSDQSELRHGDVICFGECKVLIHIHEGKDVTCNNCEPGLVQANLKSKKTITKTFCDNEKDRRTFLKQMKKKYGLANIDYCDNQVNMPSSYVNRAKQRQDTVGSDNPYEKTAPGTSLDKPLESHNKGFKMLQKMGWSSGESLGKSQVGINEPISINILEPRVGFGSSSYSNSISEHLTPANNAKKKEIIMKTQERFNQLK